MIVVVMGVSGVGKTTVGQALAERMGCEFVEGDAHHPAANVEKMRAGIPLDDDDRWPWLARLAEVIDTALVEGRDLVIACSALKRVYRDMLIGSRQGVRLVYLAADRALIASRLSERNHEYMPSSLLDSQFATLEPPSVDESCVEIDVSIPLSQAIETGFRKLAGA
ncbi:MAG: gluconokinase [Rhodospirillaceae bacterium]|jgi:gluconokinase|nr:gluconokinase [Rhodospirillaceae bacterium]